MRLARPQVVAQSGLLLRIAAAVARGIPFHATGTGVIWFLATALLFTVAMDGAAETLAARVPSQEEYIGRVPVIAIVPWFIAGSLFSITALPVGLTWVTKFLPVTHALALMRYGLLLDDARLVGAGQLLDPDVRTRSVARVPG